MKTVLITGGAGFIGSHLVAALAGSVERIVILDNLLPQVHEGRQDFSPELLDRATCVRGDVRDMAVWKSIAGDYPDIEAVVHLAAMTGTGQSMYALQEYDSINSGGTAAMLEALLNKQDTRTAFGSLRRVVLSSSRAIYGEGAYRCSDHAESLQYPPQRTAHDLQRGEFRFHCADCGKEMEAVPTPEIAPAQPTSFYGVTKLVQEQYVGAMLGAAGIERSILRFQNVFGPGQSLKNPYTGVIGVFYSNIVGGRPLSIYEDGEITRDFVYVTDVVDALVAAILGEAPGVMNIGSGQFTRLWDVAKWLCEILERDVPISCTGTFRVGDIRSNSADLRRAAAAFGYEPKVSVREGLRRYADWASNEQPMDAATIEGAAARLRAAGLAGAATINR